MRRLNRDERGGLAVLAALLIPFVMIPMVAIVVDVGALYAERRQLQNGADAAALAIAQQCAENYCGDSLALANLMADANANDGVGGVEDATVSTADGRATVVTRSEEPDGREAVSLSFARIFGNSEATVRATGVAGWGGPSAGSGFFPLVVSWCAFSNQTDGGIPSDTTEYKIRHLENESGGCTSPSGMSIPAGWGWLTTDDEQCIASADTEAVADGKPGVSTPGDCEGADFDEMQDATILLPLFEEAGGTGESGWFEVYGFAAFRVTAYRFACPSRYRWNDGGGSCGSTTSRFIQGYFTEFVTLDDAFELGGPDLGGRVVRLTD